LDLPLTLEYPQVDLGRRVRDPLRLEHVDHVEALRDPRVDHPRVPQLVSHVGTVQDRWRRRRRKRIPHARHRVQHERSLRDRILRPYEPPESTRNDYATLVQTSRPVSYPHRPLVVPSGVPPNLDLPFPTGKDIARIPSARLLAYYKSSCQQNHSQT